MPAFLSMFRRPILILLLWPILVAFQVALFRHAPWWDLPVQDMVVAGGIAFFMVLLCAVRLSKLEVFWAVLIEVLVLAWAGGITLVAPWVGTFEYFIFVTLCLSYSLTVVSLLRNERRRSWVDSRAEWYQGSARQVPGARVHFNAETFGVSNIDGEGVFLVAVGGRQKLLPTRGEVLTFELETFQGKASARGRVLREIGQGTGVGVRIEGMSPDQSKLWGDLVQGLRSRGYDELHQ